MGVFSKSTKTTGLTGTSVYIELFSLYYLLPIVSKKCINVRRAHSLGLVPEDNFITIIPKEVWPFVERVTA